MSELKPCPFCGGDLPLLGDDGAGWFSVCETEGCPLNGDQLYATRVEAIAAWNRRAEPGWVRVEDGLPVSGQRILGFPDVEGRRVVYGTYMETGTDNMPGLLVGCSGGVLEMPGHVTHWRPLPPAPEE